MSLHVSAPVLSFAYQLLTFIQPHRAEPYSNQPQTVSFVGDKANVPTNLGASQPIPSRIWSYWHEKTLTPFVQQCINNWHAHCPEFEINVLNSENISEYVNADDFPVGFAQLDPVKQSDWIRLYLVSHHGGYWLDATILLTQSLHWLEALRNSQSAEFAGFYLDGYTRDLQFPVLENWAFGSAANSAFIMAWYEEFHHALFEKGVASYLEELGDSSELLQGIPDPIYLLGHVTAQRVLRRNNDFRLALVKAEDTAYFYQKILRWKWYLLYARLCLVKGEPKPAPLVKLRGGERRHFTQLFSKKSGLIPGSIWSSACAANKTHK